MRKVHLAAHSKAPSYSQCTFQCASMRSANAIIFRLTCAVYVSYAIAQETTLVQKWCPLALRSVLNQSSARANCKILLKFASSVRAVCAHEVGCVFCFVFLNEFQTELELSTSRLR